MDQANLLVDFFTNSSGVDVMITIFCEKIGVFLKSQCYDPLSAEFSSIFKSKIANFLADFLAKIF
jgi:hypothetical protein